MLAILLFAVTNYINLTVANTGFRAKEMATRRLLGSNGLGISLELIGESTLMVFISFIIGGALALLLEDKMAVLFKGKIDILKDINLATVSVSLVFIILTGVILGNNAYRLALQVQADRCRENRSATIPRWCSAGYS